MDSAGYNNSLRDTSPRGWGSVLVLLRASSDFWQLDRLRMNRAVMRMKDAFFMVFFKF